MDRLEKYIQQNKDAFDDKTPDSRHKERFQEKVKQQAPITKVVPMWKNMVKIASVVAVLVVAGTIFLVNYPFNSPKAAEQGVSLSEVSPEYKEVETYLQSNLDKKIKEFKSMECPNGEVEKQEVLHEVSRIDTMYQELQEDLQKNRGNERIINAMINTYQTRIEILEQVMNQVKTNC